MIALMWIGIYLLGVFITYAIASYMDSLGKLDNFIPDDLNISRHAIAVLFWIIIPALIIYCITKYVFVAIDDIIDIQIAKRRNK